jgi:hypothetical protein
MTSKGKVQLRGQPLEFRQSLKLNSCHFSGSGHSEHYCMVPAQFSPVFFFITVEHSFSIKKTLAKRNNMENSNDNISQKESLKYSSKYICFRRKPATFLRKLETQIYNSFLCPTSTV